MSKKSITGIGWDEYVRLTMPKNASQVQLHETRKAFFFGAATVFFGQLAILEEGEDATEKDLAIMDDVHSELDAFLEEMDIEGETFKRGIHWSMN